MRLSIRSSGLQAGCFHHDFHHDKLAHLILGVVLNRVEMVMLVFFEKEMRNARYPRVRALDMRNTRLNADQDSRQVHRRTNPHQIRLWRIYVRI